MIPVQQRSRKRGTDRQTVDDDVVVPREERETNVIASSFKGQQQSGARDGRPAREKRSK